VYYIIRLVLLIKIARIRSPGMAVKRIYNLKRVTDPSPGLLSFPTQNELAH
jgi:hypothetical protein